jgi:hypothetical protein
MGPNDVDACIDQIRALSGAAQQFAEADNCLSSVEIIVFLTSRSVNDAIVTLTTGRRPEN